MKRLIVVLMGLGLLWGIFKCQEANAESKWVATGSLEPGVYMLLSADYYNTAMYAEAILGMGEDFGEMPYDIGEFVNGIIFNITKDKNIAGIARYLNNPPLYQPERIREFFVLEDGKWIQTKLPCRFIDGEIM